MGQLYDATPHPPPNLPLEEPLMGEEGNLQIAHHADTAADPSSLQPAILQVPSA
jgi:hypothetical protein